MGLRDDFASRSGGTSTRARTNPNVDYDPRSTSLLSSRLRDIQRSGNEQSLRQAKKAAQGGGGSWVTRAMQDTMRGLGIPLRAVVAGVEELGEQVTGKEDDRSWLKNLRDPTYGAGRVVERLAPDLPWALKTGLGLAGDIALDPVTYLTFGAGPVLKGIGKAEGLANVAFKGMRYADDIARMAEATGKLDDLARATSASQRLRTIGAKAGAGKSLADDELRFIEDATEFMSKEVSGEVRPSDIMGKAASGPVKKFRNTGFKEIRAETEAKIKQVLDDKTLTPGQRQNALDQLEMEAEEALAKTRTPGGKLRPGRTEFTGTQALEKESLDYGIRWNVPLTKGKKGLTIPGTEGFGRAMEEAGAGISKRMNDKVGKWLGGEMRRAKIMMRSGDPELAAQGAGLIAGRRYAKAAGERLANYAGRETGDALATLQDAGIDMEEAWLALGERPMNPTKLAKWAEGKSEDVLAKELELNPARFHGGERWRKLVGAAEDEAPVGRAAGRATERAKNPVADALQKIGRFYDDVPELTAEFSRVNDEMRQFIADAAEGGRWAYVPRVGSDDFTKLMRSKTGRGLGQATTPRPGESSWFQRAAHSVGHKIGEGEDAVTLVEVGTVNDMYPGGAPSLEDQVDRAVREIYGEEGIGWYEKDLAKAHNKYLDGLSHQTADQAMQNYLLSRRIARPTLAAELEAGTSSAWRPDLFGSFQPGKGVTTYSGKVLNQGTYHQFQNYLRSDDGIINAVSVQFGGDIDAAIAHVDGKLADTETMFNDLATAGERAMPGGTDEAMDGLIEQQRLLTSAKDHFTMYQAMDPATPEAQLVLLQGSRDQIESNLVGHSTAWEVMRNDKTFVKKMNDVLSQGWEGYGFGRQAPSETVEVLADIARQYDPQTGEGLSTFMRKVYDPINSWLKGWMTTSPGFLWRNVYGGVFNNWLANANVVRSTIGWGKILKKAPEARTAEEQAIYSIMERLGILNTGFYTSDLGTGGKFAKFGSLGSASRDWSLNPFAGIRGGERTFIAPFVVRRTNERLVEPLLRGSLAYDRIVTAVEQGRFASVGVHRLEDIADPEVAAHFVSAVHDSPLSEQILADVAKYHFDYDDLSKFERGTAKRIIPFYTWTRKNVPLQLEAMFTQPGKALAGYASVKRNLEAQSEAQDVTPMWFGQSGMVRLPWQTEGGQVYGSVDLPFKDPFELLDIGGQGASMVSPLLKAPIEAKFGKQFFGDLPLRGQTDTGGLKPMQTVWKPLIPLMQMAAKLPFSPVDAPVKGKSGEWLLSEKDNYLYQQYFPFLAQAQRLAPDTGKYQDRFWSTWASFTMGVQLRTNTPADMESEMFRRSDQVNAIANVLKATGDIPSKTKPQKRQGMPLSKVLAGLDANS